MDKKRKYLGTNEINKVIDVWRDHIHELKGVHRNHHVFKNMCSQLKNQHNLDLTPTELRSRINNLTKKYRTEKRNAGKSGETPSTWQFYMLMHNILGGNKALNISEMMHKNIKQEHDIEADFDLESLLQSPHKELNETAAYSSSDSSAQKPATCYVADSPAASNRAASTSIRFKKKKRKNPYDDIYRIMEKDQKMMEHFLNKTLENDEMAINLLRENNQLLAQLINKT